MFSVLVRYLHKDDDCSRNIYVHTYIHICIVVLSVRLAPRGFHGKSIDFKRLCDRAGAKIFPLILQLSIFTR